MVTHKWESIGWEGIVTGAQTLTSGRHYEPKGAQVTIHLPTGRNEGEALSMFFWHKHSVLQLAPTWGENLGAATTIIVPSPVPCHTILRLLFEFGLTPKIAGKILKRVHHFGLLVQPPPLGFTLK